MKKAAVAGVVILIILAYVFLQKQNNLSTVPSAPSSSGTTGNENPSPTSQSQNQVPSPTASSSASTYKDGAYTGDSANAFYGNIQVQATISGGKITDIQLLQYPNDSGHSTEVSSYALPQLKQEAIQSQNANVDSVSGATQTSQAFVQSLSSALAKAQ